MPSAWVRLLGQRSDARRVPQRKRGIGHGICQHRSDARREIPSTLGTSPQSGNHPADPMIVKILLNAAKPRCSIWVSRRLRRTTLSRGGWCAGSAGSITFSQPSQTFGKDPNPVLLLKESQIEAAILCQSSCTLFTPPLFRLFCPSLPVCACSQITVF